MVSPTEQQLRDLFATDAAAAPQAVGQTSGALRKVPHRRRVQTAWAAGVVGIAVDAGVLTTGGLGQQPQNSRIAAPAGLASEGALPGGDPGVVPTGERDFRGGESQSCVEAYSPTAVAGSSFAFDGTVTAIGPARSNRPGVELPLAGVTFRVNEWFRGGSGDTGTRLLVSGEPRWGGAALDAAIAWACGFTRYHDPHTAAEWAAATN